MRSMKQTIQTLTSTLDNEETAYFVDDIIAIEIVERTLKLIDHKFQVTIPFWNMNINLLDNYEQVHT